MRRSEKTAQKGIMEGWKVGGSQRPQAQKPALQIIKIGVQSPEGAFSEIHGGGFHIHNVLNPLFQYSTIPAFPPRHRPCGPEADSE
jgi:hypothetical protein